MRYVTWTVGILVVRVYRLYIYMPFVGSGFES